MEDAFNLVFEKPATSTLITKVLLPRRREDVLTRQRLLDRLYDLVDHKVVLISAPAGYGKTTLLADFAHDLEHPVCWYTLDESDRDPRVFLEHLILSLHHRFSDFGERTRQALAATTDLGNGAPGVVNVLLNEVVDAIPRWFVLVLDDYHRLGEAPEVGEVEAGLAELDRACERLQQIGAHSELARARFFTAWALFQAGRETEALTTLQQVLATADPPTRESLPLAVSDLNGRLCTSRYSPLSTPDQL